MANVQQLYQTLRIPEYRRFGMNLIQDTNKFMSMLSNVSAG